MTVAFTFPGQGSQVVGMGQELAEAYPAARSVFDEVDDALGEKLSAVMWEGPAETLTLTRNAQPALMAVSMAVIAVLEQEFGITVAGKAGYVAGHSLGEYSGPGGSGNVFPGGYGATAAHSWRSHAGSDAGRHRRHGRLAGA